MHEKITVCIPSIPPRRQLLHRAIGSVLSQTHQAAALSVVIDHDRVGAAGTRQRALMAVQTPWVAFLDDDDEFKPEHLEHLLNHARETGADYVYSWYELVLYNGRVSAHDYIFGDAAWQRPFNPNDPKQTTVVTLIKTELAKSVGFCEVGDDGGLIDGQRIGEDYQFTLGCLRAGAKISHLVEKTWFWHHDSENTSGRPNRW